jgi:hypothetical protein
MIRDETRSDVFDFGLEKPADSLSLFVGGPSASAHLRANIPKQDEYVSGDRTRKHTE